MGADIIVVRSSSVIYDARVNVLVKSLCKKYSVSVLGWNRERIPLKKLDNYFVPLELFNLRAPSGKVIMIIYFPLFWAWTMFKLLLYRPNVVHACDLDTILPCYIYKSLLRKRLVFDLTLRYAMAYIPANFKSLHLLVNLIEELFSRTSDILVVEGEKVLQTFRKKPKNFSVIMNCPEDYYIERPKSGDNNDNILTLVYTGMIRKNRGLECITAAIKDLNDVELVTGGAVLDKQVMTLLAAQPNVRNIGMLSYGDTLSLEAGADVMVALYDLGFTWNTITMPNKILEAMMCGIPVITNVQSDVIDKFDCGIVVRYNDIEQTRAAIVSLRDNKELRQRLGDHGRKAYLQRYTCKLVDEELYKIYDYLLTKQPTRVGRENCNEL